MANRDTNNSDYSGGEVYNAHQNYSRALKNQKKMNKIRNPYTMNEMELEEAINNTIRKVLC